MASIGKWPCPNCSWIEHRAQGLSIARGSTEHTAVDTQDDGAVLVRCEKCGGERRVGMIVLPADARGEKALSLLPKPRRESSLGPRCN